MRCTYARSTWLMCSCQHASPAPACTLGGQRQMRLLFCTCSSASSPSWNACHCQAAPQLACLADLPLRLRLFIRFSAFIACPGLEQPGQCLYHTAARAAHRTIAFSGMPDLCAKQFVLMYLHRLVAPFVVKGTTSCWCPEHEASPPSTPSPAGAAVHGQARPFIGGPAAFSSSYSSLKFT